MRGACSASCASVALSAVSEGRLELREILSHLGLGLGLGLWGRLGLGLGFGLGIGLGSGPG